jgi:hypothetical protein
MVRHQIVMQLGEQELTLTLIDTKLVIHGGETRLDQEFASEAELVEHALRVVKLRQHQGYRVIGERKADKIVMPPELEPAELADPAPKLKA